MSVLSPPRHPIVERALRLSRRWCDGRIIDDAPALRHAVLVARTLLKHVPDATPEMVAATLLHDAPEFAPPEVDLDLLIGQSIAPIVRAIAAEHADMMAGGETRLDELPILQVSAADKIVAFRALVRRARLATDETGFWSRRAALRGLLPYFGAWCQLAGPLLPPSMAHELGGALTMLRSSIERHAPAKRSGDAMDNLRLPH